MNHWENLFQYTIILFLGLSIFLLGLGWHSTSARLETLSQQNQQLEIRITDNERALLNASGPDRSPRPVPTHR